MANHRLIHHPIAQGLLAIFILTTSCTDEVQQPRLESRISFHTEIQNTWISFDQNERRAETRSTVSTLQSNSGTPFYLHTLYADSIASPFSSDSVPATRSIPVTSNNMYDAFGISAYAYTGSWNNTQKPNYMYDVTVSKTGSSWLPASTHYWPGNAYKLKFFAYAPQNNNAYQLSGQIAGAPTVTCTIPDNVAEQQDLLVAASEEINGGTNTAVNLRFRHALTAVKFVCGQRHESRHCKKRYT